MTILVTGATGNVGRHVVSHLAAAGHKVRALTRKPSGASFPEGVEAVAGDLTDPAALAPAMRGATALHLITFGGEGYAPLQTGAELVDMAERAGVRKVTVLRGQPGTVEDAVRASAMDWTLVTPMEFMSGVFDWAGSIRAEGVVRAPFADARSPMVHDGDIGASIAKVLTSDGHAGKSYELTGPAALSVRDKVSQISAGLGREIRYEEMSEDEARTAWAAEGLPAEVIEFFVMAHGTDHATVLPTVEELTGRPARTLAEFVREHAARF
jgi:uncharacterized protein YbjT (DUF2867 family)